MSVVVLVLGVGWAHERLFRRGIAERAIGWACAPLTGDVSWWVGELTSMIVLRGEPSDVRRAAETVTGRLAEGPRELEPARVTDTSSPDGPLLRLRYGHQGYGLAGAARYGHRSADAAAVRAWLAMICAETFSTVGDDEPGPLHAFPHGVPPAAPSRREMLSTPGAVVSADGFGVSWLADRTPTAALASQLMVSAIAAVLPDPGPTTRRVLTGVRSIGADTQHVCVVSNERLVAGHHVAGICRELERLRRDGPGVSELVAAVDQHARSEARNALESTVDRAVQQMLGANGYRLPAPGELDTDVAVLADTVRRHCDSMLMTCAALPPTDLLPAAARLDPSAPARGRTHRPARVMVEAGMTKEYRFEVSGSALTLHAEGAATVTVDGLVLVEAFPDGERTAYDRDGVRLHIDPLVWRRGSRLVEWVDAHGADLTVQQPDSLPASRPVSRAALRARPGFAVAAAALAGVLAPVFAVGAVTNPGERVFLALAALGSAAATVGLVQVVRYAHRLQRRVAVRSALH